MQEVNNLFNDIRYLKGVGPKRALDFNRLGVNNPRELLYLFPRRYQDRSAIKKISELKLLETTVIRGEVRATYLRRSRRNVPIYEAVVDDGSSMINISWFNQPYLKNVIKKGFDIILYGKVEFYKGLRMNSPDYEVLDSREPDLGIVAVYPLSGSLTQRFIRNLVKDQLEVHKESIREIIPEDIIRRYSIMNRIDALFNLHYPKSLDSAKEARDRLIFEDIFITQLAIAIKRVKRKVLKRGASRKFLPESILNFKSTLPFKLTDSQERVLKKIEKDMLSSAPMNRLVQGEVGSGKTIIAAYSSLLAASGGHQAAIMVPTEILAQQQYIKISEMLSDFNVEVGLLIGNMDKGSRGDTIDKISSGNIAVVIGTHALLQQDIQFKNLSLVIVDEQHKFGVQQRRVLREKGFNPDYLIMAATPIPRTLALTVFGDMDISTIKEMPFGDKRINTYWVNSSKRARVYSFLKEEVDSGSQGFVVCPRIEDSEDGLRDVETVYEELKVLLGAERVELLHGKMSNDEKNRAVASFRKREISILVSTVVVEVGIDIPGASIILIEDADRFGLSQLHQLRGRVGRVSQDAYCILLADPKTEEAYRRLNIMADTNDGFKISEEDLKIRGSGEFWGLKQHGFISSGSFQIAFENRELLERARDEVETILSGDLCLKDFNNSPLYCELKSRFRFI